MTEEEYILKLKSIITQIQNKQVETVEAELMELYKYKPVRLLWYVAHAYLLYMQENPERGLHEMIPYCMESLCYLGVKEFVQYKIDVAQFGNNEIELQRIAYLHGNKEIRADEEKKLEVLFQNIFDKNTKNQFFQLMQQYFMIEEKVVFLIFRMYLKQSGLIKEDDRNAWYYKEKNYDYLEEKVLHSQEAFLLIEEEKNGKECNLLAMLLHELGHPVYILAKTMEVENVDIHSEDILNVCLENVQAYEESIVIPVCEVVTINGQRENNRGEIIRYLYEKEFERNYAILFASGTVFYELLKNQCLQKNIECLSEFDWVASLDKMYFGWTGNYLLYISDIYGFDVETRMLEEADCDFSIVVPARNSAGTLYYTLRTCLNQDYTGSYEIIVSDNSTDGRQEVYQVCKDLNDPHIKYVKTPRNLSLSKSFEFAFLQARGEFIFSIGSDDGVCPWALSTLKNVMEQHPDEEVIQWVRGFYGWKGFETNQEDKLIIPGRFTHDNMSIHYEERIDYFAKILKHINYIFTLPNLYLNSGFRRSYFKTLLLHTGRLWDGCNQDIYMGIISAAINDKILNIEYPLTIAGMSNNSLGYVVSKPINKDVESEKDADIKKSSIMGDNVGIYVINGIVREIPLGSGNVFSMYANLYRAIQLGVLPEEWRGTLLNDKIMFLQIIQEYSPLDDNFDKYIHYDRYLAELKGSEFLKWFDETIYKVVMQPRYFEKEKEETIEKSYKEGPTEGGGLALDASKYGVTNIAEAMELFVRFVHWTPESWQKELKEREEHA